MRAVEDKLSQGEDESDPLFIPLRVVICKNETFVIFWNLSLYIFGLSYFENSRLLATFGADIRSLAYN